ncbi:MAG: FAD-dependent oxidoreductase [Sphaerochaeta associata]|uniref:phytoene desaturase family protein n=1 Tax=Sphaerochaeta associata TaxID=1129264 RepID=UPI002B21D457|nr:FAD-dependent oxidoreductase [Sphaerochaeta associata]MEA5107072.1 FAD-dependent oxidoreductase [Sphaerochaeta associata]
MKKAYDVVVVGGGIAGLTAAVYCARAGLSVLLCEKQDRTGGLVNSFERNGFVYDQGIRAIENSGIVFPMLKQLGIEMNWVRSLVTLAIGSEKVIVTDTESLSEYQKMLDRLFPQNIADIALIMDEIRKITRYMDVLYGIDNPLFLDNYQDLGYVRKTLLPWLMRYLGTIGKIDRLNEPVVAYLSRFTKNKALIDIIAQHFFADTPTFFALSYFGLYCEYQYPMGGTGKLTDALYTYLKEHGVDVLLDCPVTAVDIEKHTLLDGIAYKKLIWAADLKALYRSVDEKQLSTHIPHPYELISV